jgi:hypothetical protein
MPTRERSVRQVPPIVNNPRPYHHAPSQPRSMAAAHLPGAQPRVAGLAQPYHHAPDQPTSVNVARYPHNAGRASMDGQSRRNVSGPAPTSPTGPASGGASMNRSLSGAAAPSGDGDLRRSDSGKYRRRLRDAGFAGAAAAVAGAGAAGVAAHQSASADRGKALYDENRGTQQPQERSPVSPITPKYRQEWEQEIAETQCTTFYGMDGCRTQNRSAATSTSAKRIHGLEMGGESSSI